jgi:two-component system response regulator (stage 0 sporulation protein F)
MNRILIVDDDRSIQLLYEDALTEEGYEVITAGDRSRVLGLIEKKRPDLIVLDIGLGDYNGLHLLQAIRHRYIDLPVILCTAYPAFAHDLKSAAADYYLVKSSDLGELKLKVEMAMNGRAQVLESGKREGTIGADSFVSMGTE